MPKPSQLLDLHRSPGLHFRLRVSWLGTELPILRIETSLFLSQTRARRHSCLVEKYKYLCVDDTHYYPHTASCFLQTHLGTICRNLTHRHNQCTQRSTDATEWNCILRVRVIEVGCHAQSPTVVLPAAIAPTAAKSWRTTCRSAVLTSSPTRCEPATAHPPMHCYPAIYQRSAARACLLTSRCCARSSCVRIMLRIMGSVMICIQGLVRRPYTIRTKLYSQNPVAHDERPTRDSDA